MPRPKKTADNTTALSVKNVDEEAKKGFLQTIQRRYIEQYADTVLKMIDDQKKLQKAVTKLDAWLKRIDAGDFTACEEYKKRRRNLEEVDDSEF